MLIDAFHAERQKNTIAEEFQKRLATRLLNNQPSDYEIGIAVLPLGAGLEVERLARPLIQNLVGSHGLQHGRHHVILRPVVLIAGGMRKQFANCDLVAARQVGDKTRHRIVER